MEIKKPIVMVSGGAIAALMLVALAANAMYRHIQSEIGYVAPAHLGLKAYAFGRCYPSTYGTPQALRQATEDKATYWEVQAQSRNPSKTGIEYLDFRTENSKCAWLNRNKAPVRLTYMPQTAAIALSVAQYRPMLEQCKRANARQKDPGVFCVQDMTQGLSGTPADPQVLYPEEVIALKQIGVDAKKIANVRFASVQNDM